MIIKGVIFLLLISAPLLLAQRSVVNEGVDLYKQEKFTDAEVNFKKGIQKAPDNFEARFNLGDAFYKQGRFDESVNEFYSSLELTEDPALIAKVHHNIGNSLFKAQKIKESVDAYKNALKLNPSDMETKYNLSYAISLLDKEQQQQNRQNDDQNNDQNQDQNDQNQDNQNNQQQNDQKKPPQNEQAQQDNLKNQQNRISKEEAERILQALKNNEQEIQKKLRQKTGPTIKRDKDW